MNAGYGAISNRWFRDYFDIRIAASITATGRMINKWNIHHVNKQLNDQLETDNFDYAFYGDTDSNYITMKNLVDQKGWTDLPTDDIVHNLDEWYKENLDPTIDEYAQDMCDLMNGYEQKMVWSREVIAQSAVWQAPKLYIMAVNNSEGVAYATPKVKIMGVAARKSSFPQWCRDRMAACYKTVLLGTEEELQDQVKQIGMDYMNLSVEEIAGASSVSNIHKYTNDVGMPIKGAPYNSKASILYNNACDKKGLHDEERINEGDKMVMAKLIEGNPLQYGYIAFPTFLPPELGLHDWIDYKGTYEKMFLHPMDLILEPRGWESKKRVKLFDSKPKGHAQGKKVAPKNVEVKTRKLF